MNKINRTTFIFLAIFLTINCQLGLAQRPYRTGTTTANFLEIGMGSDGLAMGDAFVSMGGNLSSLYWNPAGLAFLKQNEVMFGYQPLVVDINSAYAAGAILLPPYGNLAFGFFNVDYGDMKVTTLDMQDGTGELFTANEYAFTFSYSRKLAQWFSFGVSAKYISSQIWHTKASATALDLGVIVNTHFFAPAGSKENGMKIGMSISNYGTKMRYDGMDLLQLIDIEPDEAGNYSAVPGQFKTHEWELPLIFRIGVSVNPILTQNHRLTLSMDALHPNNNSESLNLGVQYEFRLPGTGSFFLRGGYRGLFLNDSEYGVTYGGGLMLRFMNNYAIRTDYAFKTMGVLGNTNSYTVGILF